MDHISIYCQTQGLPLPKKEHKFWPGRRFKFDYAWPDYLIALEVEGGFYGKGEECPHCGRREVGAHTSVQRLKSDKEKYNEAHLRGWLVLRCQPEEVKDGRAFNLIDKAFAKRKKELRGG